MVKVSANFRRNRLYVILRETNRSELQSALEQVETACTTLLAGFDCLVIFCKGVSLRSDDADLIYLLQEIVASYGAAQTVQVIRDDTLLKQHLGSMPGLAGRSKVATVASVKAAKALLQDRGGRPA